ncbi:autotransporter outer membrane beta-barrel domain-containing protein [Bartonella doshiae]|uniref:autotransporter outer membrane beta-barrel domain-containing protein n=4 Tax=Bartonella doshiae TaxID=33044 RepID=UPI001ABB10D9|nr:autotransporter outer membrane beta-barrel domain-containing protein [Bartonella doshiae]
MSKKSLLSCTAAATVILLGAHFNAQAEILKDQEGKTITESKKSYESISATNGGTIYGIDLTLVGPSNPDGAGVVSAYYNSHNDNAPRSTIELYGNTTVKSTDNGLVAFDNGTIKMTGGTIDSKSSMAASAQGKSAFIQLDNVTINAGYIGLAIKDNGMGYMTGGSITSKDDGVDLLINGSPDPELESVKLENVNINAGAHGINNSSYNVTLKNVTITSKISAIHSFSVDNSLITVSGGSLQGDINGVEASYRSTIILNDHVNVTSNGSALYAESYNGKIVMTGGGVEGKTAAFAVKDGGRIDVTDVFSAKAEKSGIRFEAQEGIRDQYSSSEINLTNTKLFVENGTGIFTNSQMDTVNLKNSMIYADILLLGQITEYKLPESGTKPPKGIFTLNADSSILEGGAKITDDPTMLLNLNNGTKWLLKISTKEKDKNDNLANIDQRSRSDVSILNLNNSTIAFDEPERNYYQTLHVGSGKLDTTAVYNATGNAKIYFNIEWSDGATQIAQKTDRVIIHGDVTGTTTVYFTGQLGDESVEEDTSLLVNTRGVSLIQVSGNAKEDSFKLINNYTTMKGLPYKYTLTAYGPTSSHGKANIEQSLFEEKNEDFWDFRLQNAFLDSDSQVKAPVAQTASYIVMPNVLFTAGFTDMLKQSALLADIHTAQSYSFFLSPYGNTATLTSERGALKYGYNADIFYAATQAGVTSAAMENKDFTIHLGALGTYGQLSFTPQDIEDTGKSTLNKWAATAYGTLHHNNGLYLDILASYGIIDGSITTAVFKSAAKLNNTTTLSTSATVGKEFVTDAEGIKFEPQVQLIYQQLLFDTIEDADNLKIDMKNPSQWLARIGGRLSKTVSTENDNVFSFYGKVNFLKTFGDDGKIQIGDIFDLDPMGASLEGGVGINAHLSQNFSIHGDVSYQQKLQKTGITGASFSGGIRYQF